MKKICFVGIDTSNYTTSAAVCDADGKIVANLKRPLPVSEGGRGLRQSDAVFAHVKNLPDLMAELGEVLIDYTPVAVGYSATPRDAEGSYMPCFLTGEVAANSFAAGLGIPTYAFSHQNGHIRAAAYSSGEEEKLLGGEFCAFHVSGGTTEILHVTPTDIAFDVKLVGGTKDINAGQAIDRAGVNMGLKFPCGPALETLAIENKERFPTPKISVEGLECNLSGLENLSSKLWRETENAPLTAAYVLDFVGKTLRALSKNLRGIYPDLPILYAGGVMSNSIIKNMLSPLGNVCFAQPAFSADNAAGTALLCRDAHSRKS